MDSKYRELRDRLFKEMEGLPVEESTYLKRLADFDLNP